MGTFGYDKTDYSKEFYKAFKGNQSKRTSGAEKNYLKGNDIINKMNDPLLNVGYEREHYGGVKIKAAGSQEGGQNMQFQEEWSHAGGNQTLPDGSQCSWCGGTRNSYSGSNIATTIGPSDAITSANHDVTRSGCGDNTDMPKSGAKPQAGSKYHESGNDSMDFSAGNKLTVNGRNKAGGMCLGNHAQVTDSGGSGEKGYGWSVCNGDDWQIFHGGFGDNMYVCAVGAVQAASQPKGTYTLTVDKQGNLTIKTGGTVTIESQGAQTYKAPSITLEGQNSVTIKAPTHNIEANIKHKGSMKTTKSHVDKSGPHPV